MIICNGHNLCSVCRNREFGRQFRVDVLRIMKLSIPTDFDCTEKKEWINGELTLPVKKTPDRLIITPAAGKEINAKMAELSKTRFEICKNCDQSLEQGQKCVLHKGCCFGRWRGNPDNKCFIGKW